MKNVLMLALSLMIMLPTQMRADQSATAFSKDDAALCLAQAMFFEARGEGRDGKLAVGVVYQNRAEKEMWGDTHVCEAIYRHMQASFANGWPDDIRTRMRIADEKMRKIVVNDEIEADAYLLAQKLAEGVVSNSDEVQAMRIKLSGADHFLTHVAYRKASSKHWAKVYRHITSIGGHRFHRWLS